MISLPLRYSQIILSCLVLISIIACTNSDEKWIPYLCKVTDYYDCQEREKMIFPIETTYADKETWYPIQKTWNGSDVKAIYGQKILTMIFRLAAKRDDALIHTQ